MGVEAERFAYDASMPLRFEVSGRDEQSGAVVERVSYEAAADNRVEAFVVRPARSSKASGGVLLAHGGFEGGKHLFVDEAVEFARAGFTVLVADVAFPRSGNAATVEAAFRANVITHRRGVDVLTVVQGVERFGFFGHSRGGSEAAILAAVEPRLGAVVVAGMGSPSDARKQIAETNSELRDYFEALFEFDVGAFLRVRAPRRLLVQHGRFDNEVTLSEARAMFDVACEPKIWREYSCGHGITSHSPARADRIAFFADVLSASHPLKRHS